MAEVSYRKVRETLLAKMEEFRSQGKTALANKLNRIDIALINGQTVEAKRIARGVKITEVDISDFMWGDKFLIDGVGNNK